MATSWAPYHPSASASPTSIPSCVAPVGELLGLGEPPFTHREHHVQSRDEIAQAVAAIHDEVLAELSERAGGPAVAERGRGRPCARRGPSARRRPGRSTARRRSARWRARGVVSRAADRAGSGAPATGLRPARADPIAARACFSSARIDVASPVTYASSAASRIRSRRARELPGSRAARALRWRPSTRARSSVERCSWTQIPPRPSAARANPSASPSASAVSASRQNWWRACARRPCSSNVCPVITGSRDGTRVKRPLRGSRYRPPRDDHDHDHHHPDRARGPRRSVP